MLSRTWPRTRGAGFDPPPHVLMFAGLAMIAYGLVLMSRVI